MKTRNCNQLRQQFDDRLDGRLDEQQGAEFDRHVAVCPECGPEWHEYAAAWQVLTRPESIAPSFGFVERTVRRLDEPGQPPTAWGWLWDRRTVRWGLGIAVLALACTAGGLTWRQIQVRRAGEIYASVSHGDLVSDFDVIASLDLLEAAKP